MDKLIKSPMNYVGGKYKLLPQILPLFPNNGNINGTFVDLFCGGCNVAINVSAERIIANDLDSNVIGIYNIFKKNEIDFILDYIEKRVKEFDLSKTNTDSYLNFRAFYNNSLERNPLDLFVLICHSFSNGIRFNKRGEFNMPFGKRTFNDTMRQNLINFKLGINNITFTDKSFDEFNLDMLSTNDFVYCDPPYLITCATYNDGWDELCENKLLSLLNSLNERKIKFALSNVLTNNGKENDILSEWSKNYNVHHLVNSYSNCSYHRKNHESITDEVLITNY